MSHDVYVNSVPGVPGVGVELPERKVWPPSSDKETSTVPAVWLGMSQDTLTS